MMLLNPVIRFLFILSVLIEGLLLIPTALAEEAASLNEKHSLPAHLEWSRRVELGLSQSGIINKVHVKLGEQVKKQHTLLSLKAALFQADIKIAQAGLRRAQAALNEVKREFERTQELHEQTLIAAHEFEVANNALISAQAEVDHAKAQLTRTRELFRETRLVAPFSGRIVAISAAAGQAVVNRCQAQTLVVLADTETLHARAWWPVAAVKNIQLGQRLEVQVQGENYSGEVVHVGFQAEERQGQWYYAVDVSITPQTPLRAGTPAIIYY